MTQLLIDFIPIIIFFVAYKFYNIFIATLALMIASTLQILYLKLTKRTIEKMHWVTLFLILAMGSLTIFFHDASFIKWKPTIIYWVFAIAFYLAPLISNHNLVEHMMGNKLELAQENWKTLNYFFIGFFLIMGAINLWVFMHYSTNIWVNYKLFGTLVLTLTFTLILSYYIVKNKIKGDPNQPDQN